MGKNWVNWGKNIKIGKQGSIFMGILDKQGRFFQKPQNIQCIFSLSRVDFFTVFFQRLTTPPLPPPYLMKGQYWKLQHWGNVIPENLLVLYQAYL